MMDEMRCAYLGWLSVEEDIISTDDGMEAP